MEAAAARADGAASGSSEHFAAAPDSAHGVPRSQHSEEIRLATRQKMLHRMHDHVPPPTFLGEGEVTPYRRYILAEWLLSLQEQYRCRTSVFTTGMMYIDKFVVTKPIEPSRLQILGSAALLLAAKMVNDSAVHVQRLCASADDLFSPDELKQMELELLAAIDWAVYTFGPHDFLWEYITDLGRKWNMPAVALRALLNDAEIYIDVCYLDHSMVVHGPATLAAAAVEYSLRTCSRGPLAHFHEASVYDIDFVPEAVKSELPSHLEKLQRLARQLAVNTVETPTADSGAAATAAAYADPESNAPAAAAAAPEADGAQSGEPHLPAAAAAPGAADTLAATVPRITKLPMPVTPQSPAMMVPMGGHPGGKRTATSPQLNPRTRKKGGTMQPQRLL